MFIELKIKTITFVALISFTTSIIAQSRYDTLHYMGQFSVLSTTGLNLRSQPYLGAEVLVSIPFNEKVEILNLTKYGRDTLGYRELWRFYDSTTYKIPIAGSWRKVKYKEHIGYMFNAFLIKSYKDIGVYYKEEQLGNLNIDYSLLYAQTNCLGNFNYNPDWYWYGFYEQGNRHIIKLVEVSFFIDDTAEFFYEVTSTNDNIHLRFILGTKQKLNFTKTNNRVVEADKRIYVSDFGVAFRHNFLKKYDLYINSVAKEQKEYYNSIELILRKNGKIQTLSSNDFYFSANIPMSLNWVGDIDGDGVDDYIVSYGDKSGGAILYLSSEAEEDQIVKPVALYRSGYCC